VERVLRPTHYIGVREDMRKIKMSPYYTNEL
jgi:hypothetical protein